MTPEFMTIPDRRHDDYECPSTMLDICTIIVPDLFHDDSPTSVATFPRVKLSKDTSYSEKMAPKPDYDTDNNVARSSPELVSYTQSSRHRRFANICVRAQLVTKVAFRHKQRAGGSIKVRPPQATGRWRIKKGRVLDRDDWVITNFAQSTPASASLNTAEPSSAPAAVPIHPPRAPFQSRFSNNVLPRGSPHDMKPSGARLSSVSPPPLPSTRIFDASQALYSW